jgi:hypothetical protein
MRPLLNASLLPKALISLRTCVEVVPIEVQERVGRSGRVSEGPKTGGAMDEGFRSVAKGFGEREAVSEVQIRFQRRSWGFRRQMGGGMVVQ